MIGKYCHNVLMHDSRRVNKKSIQGQVTLTEFRNMSRTWIILLQCLPIFCTSCGEFGEPVASGGW